ncbi:UNVERIFIED_CONTAM: hypothetical protein FKN15_070342 [Acipenser sinensis]
MFPGMNWKRSCQICRDMEQFTQHSMQVLFRNYGNVLLDKICIFSKYSLCLDRLAFANIHSQPVPD